MAERRMLAKTITESDAFLDMPQSSQNLYFHLNMNADDDGFVNNPKKIQRTVGSSNDDLNILLAKSFLIPFESGVVVIKHWKIHNYIRSDRYKPTAYLEEKNQLTVKENGSYTMAPLGIPNVIPNVPQCETQVSIGKVRLGKDNIDEKPKKYSESFESFWSLYPKKVSKGQAEKTYGAMMKRGVGADSILSCLQNYMDEIRKTGKEYQFIKNPSTFLNNYLDYEKPAPVEGRTPKVVFQARPKCECGGEFNPGGFCTKCGREIS
jgi:hypothetical protein